METAVTLDTDAGEPADAAPAPAPALASVEPAALARRRRVVDYAIIITFLALLCLPGAAMFLGWSAPSTESEKRTPAPMPPLPTDAETLAKFPAGFERHFNDTFGGRDWLIRGYGMAKVIGLGDTSTERVIVGRDGWLFFDGRTIDDTDSVADYQGSRPLKEARLAHLSRELCFRRDWLAERGIAYVLTIPPNKETVFGEFLPPAMARRADPPAPSPLDQLIERLARDGGPPVLDLRGPLVAAKAGGDSSEAGAGPVWRKTDTHWTDRAAFIAYQQIMRAAAARVKDAAVARALAPAPADDFDFVVEPVPGQDLAQMLGVAESMHDVMVRLVPRKERRATVTMTHRPGEPFPFVTSRVDDPSLPRLVMARDSFMAQSIPLIAEHFSRATYVWNFHFDPDLIEREKPAVVIDECVERLVRVYAKEQLSDFVPVEDGDIVLTDAARARPAAVPRAAPGPSEAPAATYAPAPADGRAPAGSAARGTGTLEAVNATQIAGWAWDPERPDAPLTVQVEVDGRALPPVVADVFRQDLVDAQKGNGSHGFLAPAPPQLGDGRPHTVTARVAGGGELFQSPMTVGKK